MGCKTPLHPLNLLSLSVQLRHQANLGVPQYHDPFIHLCLLPTELKGQTDLLYESAMHATNVIIILFIISFINYSINFLKKGEMPIKFQDPNLFSSYSRLSYSPNPEDFHFQRHQIEPRRNPHTRDVCPQ